MNYAGWQFWCYYQVLALKGRCSCKSETARSKIETAKSIA